MYFSFRFFPFYVFFYLSSFIQEVNRRGRGLIFIYSDPVDYLRGARGDYGALWEILIEVVVSKIRLA